MCRRLVALTAATALIGACLAPRDPTATPPRPEPPPASARLQLAAEVASVLDPTADPCVDFYQYACGGWLKRTQRPPDRPRYGRGFGQLIDRNNAALRELLEATLIADPADPAAAPLRSVYSACMELGGASATPRARSALAAYLSPISALTSDDGHRGLMRLLGGLHTSAWIGDRSALFSARVEPDPKSPTSYILTLLPGGLGLPDRDYYLADDPESARLRRGYRDHLAAMLSQLGEPPAEAQRLAARVLDFERRLAELHRPRAALRDPEAIYHRLGEDGLRALSQLPWSDYFAALDLGSVGPHLNVTVPEFFAGLPALLAALDPPTLRAYLRWQLLHATAPYIGPVELAIDEQLTAALTGQAASPPRWQRCVEFINDSPLGDLLGPPFVARALSPAGERLATAMIEALERAFTRSLDRVPWMDPQTRQRARSKLRAIANKVGQPARLRVASDFQVGLAPPPAGTHLDHALTLRRMVARRHAGQLGGPVDRHEWELSPATVNAYYSPTFNEMVFPAGVLQPPYFSLDYPIAMNFGGIGMVIGHELVHGFDDEGRRFDADGVLREWWDPATVARFAERARCVERTYSGVEVLPGVHLDGALTLGENLADLGGVRTAHAAYRAWTQEHGDEPRLLADLSGDQLFFVGFAQGWCTLSSPESARLDATVDPHAPPQQRVNLPLAHLPAFWEAFGCDPGAPMRAAEVCELW
jgi:putative endopeptidase